MSDPRPGYIYDPSEPDFKLSADQQELKQFYMVMTRPERTKMGTNPTQYVMQLDSEIINSIEGNKDDISAE